MGKNGQKTGERNRNLAKQGETESFAETLFGFGHPCYRGGGREDYRGSGREDHGRGMEDTYIKERIVDKVESGSSVAVRRGGFVFRRLPDPEESDLKKKVEETCKDKKKFEDMLELQKKKNFEAMQKIKLVEGNLEIERRRRKATEVSFKESENNCAELNKEKKMLQKELVSQKKKNAEKTLSTKLAEADVEIEKRKRKASDADAEGERKKRIRLELDLEQEMKKRRRAEEEFKKKRIALAAEKKNSHNLEEVRKKLEEDLSNCEKVWSPSSFLEVKRQCEVEVGGSHGSRQYGQGLEVRVEGRSSSEGESGSREVRRSSPVSMEGGRTAKGVAIPSSTSVERGSSDILVEREVGSREVGRSSDVVVEGGSTGLTVEREVERSSDVMVEGGLLTEVTERRLPAEAMEGGLPAEAMEGGLPAEAMEGGLPAEVMEGEVSTRDINMKTGEDRSSPPLKLHRKPKAKTAKKIKVLMPSGPFVLDVKKLEADYKESPQHIDHIKGFPRLEEEVFVTTAEDKIPGCKNGRFLNLLFNTNDSVATLEAFRLTKVGYKDKYGEDWVPLEVMPAMGPSGLRGRNLDTVEAASKSIRSEAWLNGLTWIYNTLVDFVLEKEEFRCFDWFTATAEDYDIVIGYFWLWVGPKEGGGSLGGTRFTTDSLKILKAKLVNLLLHMLKRPDIDVNSSAMRFSRSMYEMKRNKTASEPMVGNAGDRKRVAVGKEDREKLDVWLTKSPDQVFVAVCFWFNIRLNYKEDINFVIDILVQIVTSFVVTWVLEKGNRILLSLPTI